MASRKSTTEGSIISEGLSCKPPLLGGGGGGLRRTAHPLNINPFVLESPVSMEEEDDNEGQSLSCIDLRREDIRGLRVLKLHHVLSSLGLTRKEIAKLATVKKFIATKAALGAVDEEIFTYFPRLEELDLSDNKLTELPSEIKNCAKLRILRVDHNAFTTVTNYNLPKLTEFTASYNLITHIPSQFFSQIPNLQVLNLEGNLLQTLPVTIQQCQNLTHVNLRGNSALKALPISLWQNENLQEMSLDWLRFCAPPLPRRLMGSDLTDVIKTFKQRLGDYHLVADAISRSGHNLSDYISPPIRDDVTSIENKAPRIVNSVFPCFALIVLLSQRSVRVSAVDKARRTRLHVAAGEANSGVVEALLKASAFPDAVDDQSFSPLLHAVRAESFDCANALLLAGASVDCGGGIFGSSLHVATVNTDVQMTSLLLRYGADPNFRDRDGNTPLHVLFSIFDSGGDRSIAIALLLLLKGALCNAVGKEGWAPVHLAARRNQIHAFYFISDCRAFAHRYEASLKAGFPPKRCLASEANFDIDMRGGSQAWTPLHLAAHAGLTRIVLQLVNLGANVLKVNACLRTARDVAAGQFETSKILLMSEKQWLFWKVCKSRYKEPSSHDSARSSSSSLSNPASEQAMQSMSQPRHPSSSSESDPLHDAPNIVVKKCASLQLAEALLTPRLIDSNETSNVGRRMSNGLFALSRVRHTEDDLDRETSSNPDVSVAYLAASLAAFIEPHLQEYDRSQTRLISQLIAKEEGTFIQDCIQTCLSDPLALGKLPLNISKSGSRSSPAADTSTACSSNKVLSRSSAMSTDVSKSVSTSNAPLTARTVAKSGAAVSAAADGMLQTLMEAPKAVSRRREGSPVSSEAQVVAPLRIFGAQDFEHLGAGMKTKRLRDSSRFVSTARPLGASEERVSAPVETDWDAKTLEGSYHPPATTTLPPLRSAPLIDSKALVPPLVRQHDPDLRHQQVAACAPLKSAPQRMHGFIHDEGRDRKTRCPTGVHGLFKSFLRIARATSAARYDEVELNAISDWRLSVDSLTTSEPEECHTRLRNMAEILTCQLTTRPRLSLGPQLIPSLSTIDRLSTWLLQEHFYELVAALQKHVVVADSEDQSSSPVPRLLIMSDSMPLATSMSTSFLADLLLRLASYDLVDLYLLTLSQLPVESRRLLAAERSSFGETLLHKLVSLATTTRQIKEFVNIYLQFCPLSQEQLDATNKADCNRTALQIATKRGLLEVVQQLLLCGCDPNIKDSSGNTAVHTAIWNGQLQCLLCLLFHPKVDLDVEDHLGRDLMALAIDASEPQTIAMLINRGVAVRLCADNTQQCLTGKPIGHNAFGDGDLDSRICNITDRRLSNFIRKLLVGNGLLPTSLSPDQLKSLEHVLPCRGLVSPQKEPSSGRRFPVRLLLGQPLGQAVAQKVLLVGRASAGNGGRGSVVISREPVGIPATEKYSVDEFALPPSGVTTRCLFGDSLQSVCLSCSSFFWRVSSDIRNPIPPSLTPRRRSSHTKGDNGSQEPRFASTTCRNCSIPLCDRCALQVSRLAAAAFPFLEDLPRTHPNMVLQSTVRDVPLTKAGLKRSENLAPPSRATGDADNRAFLTCGVPRRYSITATNRGPETSARLLSVIDVELEYESSKLLRRDSSTLSDQAIERAISSAPKDVLAVLALGHSSPSKVGVEWNDTTDRSPPSEVITPRECETNVSAINSLGHWSAAFLGIRASYRRLAQHLSTSLSPVLQSRGEVPTSSSSGTGAFLLGLCTPRMGAVREPVSSELGSDSGGTLISPLMTAAPTLLQGAFAASELMLAGTPGPAPRGSFERRNFPSMVREDLSLCAVCASFFVSLPVQYQLRVSTSKLTASAAARNRSETSTSWRTGAGSSMSRNEIKTAHH